MWNGIIFCLIVFAAIVQFRESAGLRALSIQHLPVGGNDNIEQDGQGNRTIKSEGITTGRASTWQRLSEKQLTTYFNSFELAGLKNRSCGHFRELNDPWRWLGTSYKRPGPLPLIGTHNSGPCCVNGHTYGWFGVPLEDTMPLTMVEVTSEGVMVPPFQIQSLLRSLRLEARTVTDSTRHKQSIWIMGDSTSTQLFYGFLCAMVRIGAYVDHCSLSKESSGHYSHPLCDRMGTNYKQSLENSTAVDVTHSFAKLHYYPNGDHMPMELELHHFHDQHFCHNLPLKPKLQTFCKAHDSRFLNLATSLDRPDLFLVNIGLHSSPQELRRRIQQLLGLLQPQFGSQLVWRETTVTHFPDLNQTGLYDNFMEELPKQNQSSSCGDVRFGSSQPRIMVSRKVLAETTPNLPILDMMDAETHLWQTYGGRNPKEKHLDCLHHVYTPLYYDSMFWRLAEIVRLRASATEHHHSKGLPIQN